MKEPKCNNCGDLHCPHCNNGQEKLTGLTRFEMFVELAKSPKRTARSDNGFEAYVEGGYICWKFDEYMHACILATETWQIIEPEPEEVEFAEAFLHYYRKSLSKAKSVVTGTIYGAEGGLNLATPEEVKGKWILM